MKNLIATAALFVALAAMTPAYALTSSQAKKIKETVLSVPVPEMPATAADIVAASTKKDREDTAVTVVRAVIAKHRAAAPVVVAAVSKVAPEVSAAVARAATQAAPEQKARIVAAAKTAAPSQADVISSVTQTASVSAAPAVIAGQTSSASVERTSGVSERSSAAGGTGGTIVAGPIEYQSPQTPVAPPTPPTEKPAGPRTL